MSQYHIDTNCIHAGYTPGDGEPRVVPIVQSTTYKYDHAETLGKLFDLEQDGFFYTRLANPTLDAVEKKIAALEGGVGALLTSSGTGGVSDFCFEYLPRRWACRLLQRHLWRYLQPVL